MTAVLPERTTVRSQAPMSLRVVTARWESEGVTSYELAPVGDGTLPQWQPGAHVDIHLPSGTVRQYSLCGDPADRSRYRIAVLELSQGRGGSVEVHRELRPGVRIKVGEPRTEFALVDAERYVFVAGGIGITPILPMIREVEARGREWTLVYGARTAQHFTFGRDLTGIDPTRVRLVPRDTDGVPDLAAIASEAGDAHVFVCGPTALMDALVEGMDRQGKAEQLHLERFTPLAAAPAADGVDTFEVELADSGLVVVVGSGETVLEAVRRAGVDKASSCEMGFCGTCETRVVSGAIEHHDDLLTEAERDRGDTMMICVSRAACPRLVLDL